MWTKFLLLVFVVILVSGCVGEQKEELVTSPAPKISSISDLAIYIPSCNKDIRFMQEKHKSLIFGQCAAYMNPYDRGILTISSWTPPVDFPAYVQGKEWLGGVLYEVLNIDDDITVLMDEIRAQAVLCGNCKDDKQFRIESWAGYLTSQKILNILSPKITAEYAEEVYRFDKMCNKLGSDLCSLDLPMDKANFTRTWYFASGDKSHRVYFDVNPSNKGFVNQHPFRYLLNRSLFDEEIRVGRIYPIYDATGRICYREESYRNRTVYVCHLSLHNNSIVSVYSSQRKIELDEDPLVKALS